MEVLFLGEQATSHIKWHRITYLAATEQILLYGANAVGTTQKQTKTENLPRVYIYI